MSVINKMGLTKIIKMIILIKWKINQIKCHKEVNNLIIVKKIN